jgi:hypothetical protein
MNAGAEQAFGRVDITYPDDAMAVHQHVLYRRTQTAAQPIQALAVEGVAQRLRPERGEQRMHLGRALLPHDQTETARIAQTQGAIAEHEIHMVMDPGRLVGIDHPQAARHAKVHDHAAIAEIEHQILCPAPYAHQTASAHLLGKGWRNRLAQARIPHRKPRQHAPFDMRANAATGGFDFGQLGHRRSGKVG